MVSSLVVTVFALLTALRPTPWYDPRYAIPLLGMILGNCMTGIALGLHTLTTSLVSRRASVEAQLMLGATRWDAAAPVTRAALRSALMPTINSMSATGLVSLPGMCLDCHSNFHTNAAFHQTPDVRPQAARFRLDTVSLRGLFNQQIHGSKRSSRAVEDFTQFEQRAAYFNGDHVSAQRKGMNRPDRVDHVPMMAQMQNIIDFPPAPK